MLLPIDEAGERISISDMPEEEIVTVRVFRFLEDPEDQAQVWEQELRNVNSGSLLWLVVHLVPKMHSVAGAKYGRWFTTHYLRVCAKHFKSGYHMCEGGACNLAKTFGTTNAITSLVSGEALRTGYFWFVSPGGSAVSASRGDVSEVESLAERGWQHAGMEGALSGDNFLAEWRRQGALVEEASIQRALRSATWASGRSL